MKKLHRITLFAAVLAFGVVACGDDVQIVDPPDPPPPALTVSFSPQQVSVAVGQSVDVGLNISGGAPGATASWDCTSANSSVATASATDSGCRITGVAEGTTSVTANVTKGAQTASASAGVTVAELVRATVTIAHIRQGGVDANINNIQGQLDVTMNINPGDETPTRLDLLVDETVVASQIIDAAMRAEMEELIAEAEDPAQQIQQITLSFNTDRYEPDWEAGTAEVWHLNGERILSAQLHVAEAPAEPRASNTIPLNFNNADGYAVQSIRQTNSALDAEGRRWYGGPDSGATEITAIPVFYSGMSAAQVTVMFCAPAESSTQSSDEAPHRFEFPCANFESTAAGIEPSVSGQYADDGDATPTTILNRNPGSFLHSEYRMPTRVDNRAPQRAVDEDGNALPVYGIQRQGGLDNIRNWLNDQYNFSTGLIFANSFDDGVGKTAASAVGFQVRVGTSQVIAPTPGLTGAGLAAALGAEAESVTNTHYNTRAQICDLLGNCAFFGQHVVNAELHPLTTFGYDETDPILELDTENMGVFEEQYQIANNLGAGDDILIRGEDNASGFAPVGGLFDTYSFARNLVAVGSQFDMPEAPTRTVVVGATASAGISPTPFATLAAGGYVTPLHSLVQTSRRAGEEVNLVAQTAIDYRWTLGTFIEAQTPSPRYWIYQVRIRDQAGNITEDFRAILHNDDHSPMLEAITRGAGFPADPAFTATFTADDLELFEASLAMAYTRLGGQLVWERPTADIGSVFRMNADIQDGVPFTDFIKRPHRNLGLPLSMGDHGLPFLKNVQLLSETSGTIAATKPTSAEAQVYNGWPLEATGIIHGTNVVGQSPITGVAIPAEEVPDHSTRYSALTGGSAISSWSIVDGSAPDCNADFCARLLGPAGTFSLPFLRDGVAIVWTDQSDPGYWRVHQLGTPNFSGQFPTRDDGEERLYEWEFSGNVAGFTGDVLFGAIGINASGDGLFTSQIPPEPTFNVVFSPTSANLVNTTGESRAFTLGHGANSTGGPFTVDACEWVDAAGNLLLAPPAGLTLGMTGTGCTVTVADETLTELGTYHIRGHASQNGETDTATASVTLVAPDFAIELDPDAATVEVPDEGAAAVTQDFEVNVLSGDDPSALSCSVSPSGTGVTVAAANGANPRCVATVADDAVPGNYTITANATETGTGATASAQATLTVAGFEVALDPASSEDEPIALFGPDNTDQVLSPIVSGSRDNDDITDGSCSVVGAPAGVTATWDVVEHECLVVVDPAVAALGTFEVDVTIETTVGADVRTTELTAFFNHLPPFGIVYDFETDADDRREIERNRTANFVVDPDESDLGAGINLEASFAVVSPSGGGVTAAVIEDDGTIIMQVTVPADANTGNYTVTATFVEVGTGREVEKQSFITVTDTGQIIVDPGL